MTSLLQYSLLILRSTFVSESSKQEGIKFLISPESSSQKNFTGFREITAVSHMIQDIMAACLPI
jgi:hypothetical protein